LPSTVSCLEAETKPLPPRYAPLLVAPPSSLLSAPSHPTNSLPGSPCLTATRHQHLPLSVIVASSHHVLPPRPPLLPPLSSLSSYPPNRPPPGGEKGAPCGRAGVGYVRPPRPDILSCVVCARACRQPVRLLLRAPRRPLVAWAYWSPVGGERRLVPLISTF